MIGAGVWVVLGLAVAVAGSRMQLGTLAAPGSGFLPTVAGAALAGLGTVVLFGEWQAVRQRRGTTRALIGEQWWPVIATVIALVAYGLLLNALGLVITTFLVLGFLFRCVAKLGWAASLGWTAGATVFSHVLFRLWLKVPFPSGPWGL